MTAQFRVTRKHAGYLGPDRLPAHVTTAATRVDMHVKVLDDRVVKRAKARGLDVLVYAPHFTRLPKIRSTAERYSDEELLVVPGRELFTGNWQNRKHLLAIGLSDPVPDFISFEGALSEMEAQGAAVCVPHPAMLNVSLGRPEIRAYADHIDAIESYNAKSLPPTNRQAKAIGEESGISIFGSSYAHIRGTIGEAWTEFEVDIETETNLVSALVSNNTRRVVHRSGLGHRVRNLLEFAHLGVENTWGKADRLFLSGMEPTHPDHIAYDGRFDDVAVY